MPVTKRVDFCLVGGQVAPNLLPYLDADFRPDALVLVTTPQMQRQAERLRLALKDYLAVRVLNVEDSSAFHTNTELILTALAEESEDAEVRLNITGGTKLMAIAAYEAFRAAEDQIYYLDHHTNELRWLQEQRVPTNLHPALNLKVFLGAHGFAIENQGVAVDDDSYAMAAAAVGRSARRLSHEIRLLNRFLATIPTETPAGTPREIRPAPGGLRLHEYADIFTQAGIVTWAEDHGALILPEGEAERYAAFRFLHGGWLERLAFDAVNGFRNIAIQDVALNATITDDQGNMNELDVTFLSGNRLHVVECKTAYFGGDGGGTRANETIYKLEALQHHLGGIKTRSLILSVQEWPASGLLRAKELGIDVLHGGHVARLGTELSQWIRRAQ